MKRAYKYLNHIIVMRKISETNSGPVVTSTTSPAHHHKNFLLKYREYLIYIHRSLSIPPFLYSW